MPRLPLLLCLALTLQGCASFPTVDAAVGPEAKRAPYPSLAPLPQVLGNAPAATAQTPPEDDPAAQLDARGKALLARAKALYATPSTGG